MKGSHGHRPIPAPTAVFISLCHPFRVSPKMFGTVHRRSPLCSDLRARPGNQTRTPAPEGRVRARCGPVGSSTASRPPGQRERPLALGAEIVDLAGIIFLDTIGAFKTGNKIDRQSNRRGTCPQGLNLTYFAAPGSFIHHPRIHSSSSDPARGHKSRQHTPRLRC